MKFGTGLKGSLPLNSTAWLFMMKNICWYLLDVYLEECKYKSKKIKITKFINTELESESESELEEESGTE